MQQQTSLNQMSEKEFQTKLAELMGEISTLPASERAKLEKLIRKDINPADTHVI